MDRKTELISPASEIEILAMKSTLAFLKNYLEQIEDGDIEVDKTIDSDVRHTIKCIEQYLTELGEVI